ncbi:ABC transporter substrate-binding protein [Paenibacillus ginsengarvi]|uniref:ABC transporter substrate-binding protein n=1 Tax=Paenibacillus ginsengarvi TaxID=400777 RepID=UPI0013158038|nr:extracellular solute-binding protein [Paenibacillus ginsengarvi]
MEKSLVLLLGSIFLASVSLAGCNGSPQQAEGVSKEASSAAPSTKEPEVPPEPVTLVFYVARGDLPDEEFEAYFVKPVKKKYPHITLKLVRAGTGTQLQDMVAAGEQMDIIYNSQGGWSALLDTKLPADITELMKTEKVETSRFDPVAMGWLQGQGTPGQLLGLPFTLNGSALFYNKDIFDKFGVGYPTDHMTWDEVINLGKRVARTDGSVKYRPLLTPGLDKFASQLTPSYTDPKTDAPLLDSEKWKKAGTYLQNIYSLPNNDEIVPVTQYFKDQIVAMYAGVSVYYVDQMKQMNKAGTTFNWGMVTYPDFPERTGKAMPLDAQSLILSSTSKYKKQAFAVMAVATSEEVQREMNREGRIPGLNKPEWRSEYSSNLPFLKGKNLESIFKLEASVADRGKYYDDVVKFVDQAQRKIIGGTDVNTVLREANDAAAQAIRAKKKQ